MWIQLKNPDKQQGAALVIALILVLVSTLLGISILETSGTGVHLAANEQFNESVFRTAEAAANDALETADVSALDGESGSTTATVTSVDSRVTVQASHRINGLSLRAGDSLDLFQNYQISGQATATIDAVSARRTVIQGAAVRKFSPLN